MAIYNVDSLGITKGSNTYNITADRIHLYATLESFPETGVEKHLYITEDENVIYRWDGEDYISISSGSETEGLFTVVDTTLTVDGWSSTSPYTYNWTNNKISGDCAVKVSFLDGAKNTNVLYIEYEKISGGIQFTAPELPTSAIPVRVYIICTNSGGGGGGSDKTDATTVSVTGFDRNTIDGAISAYNALSAGFHGTCYITFKSNCTAIAIVNKTSSTSGSMLYQTELDELPFYLTKISSQYTLVQLESHDDNKMLYVTKTNIAIDNGDIDIDLSSDIPNGYSIYNVIAHVVYGGTSVYMLPWFKNDSYQCLFVHSWSGTTVKIVNVNSGSWGACTVCFTCFLKKNDS